MSWDEGLTERLPDGERDQVTACADLVGRSGARQLEFGYVHEGVPSAEAGWYCQARYRGALIQVTDKAGPAEAAMALAERLLTGARCRCGRVVQLRDGGAAFRRGRLLDGTRWSAEQAAAAGTCRWRVSGHEGFPTGGQVSRDSEAVTDRNLSDREQRTTDADETGPTGQLAPLAADFGTRDKGDAS